MSDTKPHIFKYFVKLGGIKTHGMSFHVSEERLKIKSIKLTLVQNMLVVHMFDDPLSLFDDPLSCNLTLEIFLCPYQSTSFQQIRHQ